MLKRGGKFGINLPILPFGNFEISKNFTDFKISKNEGGKFFPNFTNKGYELHKKQSININKFNKHNSITPTLQ